MERRLLLLLAHPDDETFGPGGTIARYAREGVSIRLATATRGEAGQLGDPPLTDRAGLGALRERELHAAAAVLGIDAVEIFGFGDGKLASTPFESIVARATAAIRRFRPHVVIGFGPDGVSGHPDHTVMCNVAAAAFEAAADSGRFPELAASGIPAWKALKLYRFEVAQAVFDAWGVPLRGVPADTLTTFIDTSAVIDVKTEAFYCHRTQAKDYTRILSRAGYRDFAREESYVLAASRIPAAGLPERDLFAGIPAEDGENRQEDPR
ncbi:MAG TPA: PIG-L deacetylase family protein [Candidatus Deferrimicrobiaceae bacterium]|jgi:LmbE family N-acetylglucosaminyl deacetylase